jgi:cytochrome P450
VTQARKLVKGRGLERAKRLLGDGLVTSEGDFHLRQRRLSQPAFHRQRLYTYAQAMAKLGERYVRTLVPGQVRPMHEDLLKLTLAIVGKTLFDSDIEGDAQQVGIALSRFLESFLFLMLPGAHLLEKLPLPQTRRIRGSVEMLDRIIYELIGQRRSSGRDHGDLLSMLIAAQDAEGDGSGMTDKQLRDELLTLMLAGHETTANGLTWALYLLSQHPQAEARLHAELDAVLGDRPPTPDDLPQLGYVEQVFAEALRLYPPAWILSRRCIEPLQLGTITVPVGSLVFISTWVVHRDPQRFPEPERFQPERFSPEAKAALHRFAYFPFSHGPRNCIGESFAWTEGVLVLATLARRWKFRLAAGQKIAVEPLLTLRPKYGMNMVVHPRQL